MTSSWYFMKQHFIALNWKQESSGGHTPQNQVATIYINGCTANLLYEEVADLLQQNNETWRRAEVSAVGPHQAHSVHQGANLTSDLRKLYILNVFNELMEWL